MAERFVLTAELQLQAPRNVQQVVSQIRSQLSGAATMNVKVNAPTRQIAQASKAMQTLTTDTRNASKATGELSRTLGAAARRFGAITVATGTFLAVARGIKEGVKSAIEYERELIKIAQVTGKTTRELKGLSKEVRSLATTWGVSSKEILTAARTLSQAGFAADKVTKALKVLTQTDLGATFDSIADTTEGAVAMLRQFQREAQAAGGDIKFLEQSLGAINAVSKAFAVEASDLISVIRRTGGVFEAAGGSINELIALFTSVRGTTRETAETIATGFRTIFTRIQRTETIEQLKELGIVLQDSAGKFVGPLEAIKRLSAGLSSLDPRDYRFNEIVEQLGGFRQIGKVIPLIKQYSTTTAALSVAQAGSASVAKDAETAQGSLAVQITKVKEKFDQLMATFADSSTFRSIVTGALKLAEAFIKVAAALEPVLPMLTAMLSMKIGKALMPGLGALAGRGKNQGGKIYGFNRGGMVPGTGNRDTVPAMMTPGEFVIRKSAVKKLGASNLAAANGYNNGGGVQAREQKLTKKDLPKPQFTPNKSSHRVGAFILSDGTGKDYSSSGSKFQLTNETLVNKLLKKKLGDRAPAAVSLVKDQKGLSAEIMKGSYPALTLGGMEKSGKIQKAVSKSVKAGLGAAAADATKNVASQNILDIEPAINADEKKMSKLVGGIAKDRAALSTMEGYVFEGMISALTGAKLAGGQANFDFPASAIGSNRGKLKGIFGKDVDKMIKADAKRSYKALKKPQGGIVSKTAADLNDVGYGSQSGVKLKKFASGGKVDSVPAMLTPGEYVINAGAARNIGYSRLNRMNSVAKFNSGGVVGFANGTSGTGVKAPGDFAAGAANIDMSALDAVKSSIAPLKAAMDEMGVGFQETYQVLQTYKAAIDLGMEPLEAINEALTELDSGIDVYETAILANASALEESGKKTLKGAPDKRTSEYKGAQRQRGGVAEAQEARAAAAADTAMRDQGGAFGQLGKSAGKQGKGLDTAGVEQDYIKATKAYTKAINKGRTHTEALSGAEKQLEQSIKERKKSEKEAAEAAKKAALKEVDKEIKSQGLAQAGAARSGKALEAVKGQAQAAQTMIFLAGSASALVSQFGFLSDATADAVSEAMGFAASTAGMTGTVVDMATSFLLQKNATAQNTLATQMEGLEKKKNAIATGTSTAAEAAEVPASGASATADIEEAAASKLAAAGGGGKMAGGMKAAMGIGMGFAAGGAVATFMASQTQAKADKAGAEAQGVIAKGREEGFNDPGAMAAMQQSQQAQVGLADKAAGQKSGGMGGALAGAAAGAAIGSFIPVVGTVVGGIVGGLLGGFLGASAGGAMSEADQAAFDSSNASAEANYTAAKATYDFGKSMDQIKKSNLSAQQAMDATSAATSKLLAGRSKAEAALRKAEDKRQTLVNKGEDTAVVDEQIKAAKESVSGAQKASAAAEGEMRAGIEKMMSEAITGGKTFQEAVGGPGMQGALQTYRQALLANGKSQSDVDQIMQGMSKSFQEMDKQQQRMRAIAAANERARLIEKARILEVAAALSKLSAASIELDKFGERIGGAASLIEGNFKGVGPKLAREIGDISNVADFGKFNAAVDRAAAVLGPAGARMAERVKGTAATIDNLRQGLTEANFEGLGEAGIGSNEGLQKFIAKTGIDLSKLPPKVRESLISKLQGLGTDIDQAELDKIIEDLAGSAQKESDALKKAAEIQDKYLTQYDGAVKQLIAAKNKEIASIQKYIDIEERGRDRLAKATGMTRGRRQKEAARLRRAQVGLQGTGARAGDVQGVAARARAAMATMKFAQDLNNAGQATQQSTVAGNLAAEAYKRTRTELERLADQSAKAADIMSELETVSAQRKDAQEAVQSSMKEFAFADNKGRQDLNKNFNALRTVLQSGTLASIPDDMRGAVGGLLDKFENVELMPGQTGGDISRQLQIQEMDMAIKASGGMGVTPEMMEQIFEGTSSKEQQLLQELREVNKQELAAQQELVRLNQENVGTMKGEVAGALRELAAAMRQLGVNQAAGMARGGIVQYRAGGGSIFQPRGTDTVPAMLTPGEFVVRKSAVDKVGIGALQAINSGAAGFSRGGAVGGVQYRAAGGPINVMDGDKFGRFYFGRAALLAKSNPSAFAKSYNAQFTMDADQRKKFGIMTKAMKNLSVGDAAEIMGQADWSTGYVRSVRNLLNYINENSWAFAKVGAFSARMVQDAAVPGSTANQVGTNIINATEELWGVQGVNQFKLKNIGGAKLKATNEIDDIVAPMLDPQIQMIWRAATRAGQEAKLDIGEEARKQQARRMTPQQRAAQRHRENWAKRLRGVKGNFFAQGGAATDTVPAMLTPGEFVMNAGAVKRNGLGFMKALNTGKIQGFAKGGAVYRQGGGPTEDYISNRPSDKSGSIISAINSASQKEQASSTLLTSGQTQMVGQQVESNQKLAVIDSDIKNSAATQMSLGLYLKNGLKDTFPNAFAKGGVVPGSGNRDSVGAMLTPGEFVVTKSMYKKHGGLINYLANGGEPADPRQGGRTSFTVGTGHPAVDPEMSAEDEWKKWGMSKQQKYQDLKRRAGILLQYLNQWPLGYNPGGNMGTDPNTGGIAMPLFADIKTSRNWALMPELTGGVPAFGGAQGQSVRALGLDDAGAEVWRRTIDEAYWGKAAMSKRGQPAPYISWFESDGFRKNVDAGIMRASNMGRAMFMQRYKMWEKSQKKGSFGGAQGGGAPQNFAAGGVVDSVPAMLTPGEFVMNTKAVQNNGIGFMKALNSGKVRGYKRGGFVGASYFHEGGSVDGGGAFSSALNNLGDALGNMTTLLSSAMSNFGSQLGTINFSQIGDISSSLESVGNIFLNVFDRLNTAANVLNNMNMTHNISGELIVRVMGVDSKLIADGIRQGLQQDIIRMVNEEFNRPRGFDATGSGPT
jgi:hypothetical protein